MRSWSSPATLSGRAILLICDCVDGGRGVVIRRFVWLATTKDIGKKRIMIGRDCGFFVVAGSFSFLGNDWNRGGVLGSR